MPFQTKHRRPQYGRPTMKRSGRGAPKKQDIHPSRFVKKAVVGVEADVYVPTHAFADFVVEDIIAKNIAGRGFEMPSPIQDQSIPVGLKGHDIIGIANTGTGKTVAFAVPVLNRLVKNSVSRVLIMAPTRELAQQIEDEIKWLAKGTGLSGAVLIGGASMGPQLRDLRAKPRIIVGTPGRIKDHMERGSLDISDVDTVVLDEVDRMLDMGFVHDMRDILREVKSDRQSFFFSATITGRVSELINEFSHEPITISVKTGDTSDNVEQDIIPFENKADKVDQLHRLLSSGIGKAIVFDGTQRSVERLCKDLQMAGFAADAIHGGRSQGQRQKALDRFKKGDVTILVATDVAARGIDIPDVTHVINYETPQSYDDYVHRIGRAGRAGKTGTALTFVQA